MSKLFRNVLWIGIAPKVNRRPSSNSSKVSSSNVRTEILCFAQGESGLQLAWRSPGLDASARDLLADRSVPAGFRFAVASPDRAKLLGASAQWRVLWIK